MKTLKSVSCLLAASIGITLFGAAPARAGVDLTDFGAQVGAHWGLGSSSNSAATIPGRTMDTIEVSALPGYKVAGFMVGPYLEYKIAGQTTDPASVSNQNLKGHGYLVGVGGTYDLSLFGMGFMTAASFDFLGKYSLGKTDLSGFDSTYQKPIGFHLQAGYKILPQLTADLKFSWASFKENTLGTLTSDISSNKLIQWTIGLGGSMYF